jgi:hypothetical protein
VVEIREVDAAELTEGALLAGSAFAVMVRARDFQRAAAVTETPARVEAEAVSA